MKVSEVMATNVVFCKPGDSMAKAAQVMWEGDCGCVPVTDDQRTVRGIITDRDIAMAAFTKGRELQSLHVEDAMSSKVRTCKGTDQLETALKSMSQEHIRRMPVIDEKNHIIGMLSIADALQATAQSKNKSDRQLSDTVLSTLTEITKPRRAAATLTPAPATSKASAQTVKPAAKTSAKPDPKASAKPAVPVKTIKAKAPRNIK